MYIDDLILKLQEVRHEHGNIRAVQQLGESNTFIEANCVDVVEMFLFRARDENTSDFFVTNQYANHSPDGTEMVVKVD